MESGACSSAFLWTPEEAAARESPALGPSSCGATALLDVLVALNWEPLPTGDEVHKAVAVRLRQPDAPLPEYLLSRGRAGTDHRDLIEGARRLTCGGVRGRFFPMHPPPHGGGAFLDLCRWIARWIGAGAVPVATLNLQRGVPPEEDVPDAWHHQMIHGVSEEGVFMTNPVCRSDYGTIWQQLCSERVLLVRIEDVVSRYRSPDDCDRLLQLGGCRWREMDVAGNIQRAIGALRGLDFPSIPSHIVVPARYRSGITVFAVRGSEAEGLLEEEWPSVEEEVEE